MSSNDSMIEVILQQIKQPLWENWYIKEKIGSGSFGSVYRVEATRQNRVDVSALKIEPVTADGQMIFDEERKKSYLENRRKMLVNESTIMYKLKNCRNIVAYEEEDIKPLYIDGNFEGYYFLIRMEYLSNVYQMINRKKFDFSEKNVRKLAEDIAGGLKSAHDIGVIHRDIKPANFFMSDDGVYKLGDFGISKQTASARSFAGTEGYIAPEIYRSKSGANGGYTKQADIYSLGICLYQMMNDGLFPFEKEGNDIDTAIDLRMQGRSFGNPSHASAEFSQIIMKACAFDVSQRYMTADEMLADLKSLESGNFKEVRKNYDRNATTYAQETVFTPPPTNYAQPQYQSQYIPPVNPQYQSQYTYMPQPQKDRNKAVNVLLLIIILLIVIFMTMFVVLIMLRGSGDNESGSEISEGNAVISVAEEEQETTTEPVTEAETAPPTTEPPTETETLPPETEPITAPPTEAPTEAPAVPEIPRDYEVLDTTLVVKLDEVDQLPLRSTPEKTNNIITRIPDETQVHVLGYRELETEVWFKVQYNGYEGFVRGGMLQPNNLSMLNDPIFDVPALNKWKNKFYLQTPNSNSGFSPRSAVFKGTLYFIPDLSSGVQRRFKERVGVTVTARDSSGEWYFVEFTIGSFYEGWVYNSQLSWGGWEFE